MGNDGVYWDKLATENHRKPESVSNAKLMYINNYLCPSQLKLRSCHYSMHCKLDPVLCWQILKLYSRPYMLSRYLS